MRDRFIRICLVNVDFGLEIREMDSELGGLDFVYIVNLISSECANI